MKSPTSKTPKVLAFPRLTTCAAFLVLLFLTGACAGPRSLDLPISSQPLIRLGLITGGNPPSEEQAWIDMAKKQGRQLTLLSWKDILTGKAKLDTLDVLWCHQTDTTWNEQARAAGIKIKPYLENGGKLFLDMEAVRLLNHWSIEPTPFQTQVDSIRDEGFGRPLGFHAFKEHPLFSGLHGGAYPSKQKEDHLARKTGFFGNSLPGNPEARIAGIEWTYITFRESSKLVLEYPFGKGKILAAGAFLQFEPDNYNRKELELFCRNAVEFLEKGSEENAFYWKYDLPQVQATPLPHPLKPMEKSRAWQVPELSIAQTIAEGDDSFFDLAGRRILVMGKEKGGIEEIWTHPFMAARDLQTGIFWGDTLIWLQDLRPVITVSPEMLIREYSINGQLLKEILTVSFDRPVALVHYEFPETPFFQGFVIQSTFNSRFMWPYDASATQSIYYDFDDASQTLALRAQEGALATLMGFSSPPKEAVLGQYQSFTQREGRHFTGNKSAKLQLGTSFVFDPPENGPYFNLAISGTNEGMEVLLNEFNELLPQLDSLYLPTNQYYRNLLDDKLSIQTPDRIFNEGFKWAMARTDQMFQTTPGLGTTHMAGFGTTARGWNGRHEVSGRPGYAWYFGRDGEWSGMAVNAYGDFPWVKEMLKVFARYQNLDGKIYHELTSSGAVHYDASDATPLFVVLAAHYLRYSGDLDFIRILWPNLEKAIQFCYQTDTDGDGLIENTNVGHGWIEGGALFGTHTEFYLAGTWAACLDAGAYLAENLDLMDLAHRFSLEARQIKSIIDRDFWDAEQSYFYNGKMKDGAYMKEATVLQAVPVYLQAIGDMEKARRSVQPFSGAAMSPDWGIRMIASDNPKFNPRSYHAGMVWPLYGGWASLAEYQTGFYNSGFFHFYANLVNYLFWGKGSVEETLHGTEFRPAGVCSHQCWSETMVLLPVIEGMLGLQADAPRRVLSLSPRFPWDWNQVSVHHIRIGNNLVDMEWQKTAHQTQIRFRNTNPDGTPLTLRLAPAFPPGTSFGKVTLAGKTLPYQVLTGPEAQELILGEIALLPGENASIDIEHEGGAGFLPLFTLPEPNAPSKGARFIAQKQGPGWLQATFEGNSGQAYTAKLWSATPLKAIQQAEIIRQEGHEYEVRFQCPVTETPFSRIMVKLEF